MTLMTIKEYKRWRQSEKKISPFTPFVIPEDILLIFPSTIIGMGIFYMYINKGDTTVPRNDFAELKYTCDWTTHGTRHLYCSQPNVQYDLMKKIVQEGIELGYKPIILYQNQNSAGNNMGNYAMSTMKTASDAMNYAVTDIIANEFNLQVIDIDYRRALNSCWATKQAFEKKAVSFLLERHARSEFPNEYENSIGKYRIVIGDKAEMFNPEDLTEEEKEGRRPLRSYGSIRNFNMVRKFMSYIFPNGYKFTRKVNKQHYVFQTLSMFVCGIQIICGIRQDISWGFYRKAQKELNEYNIDHLKKRGEKNGNQN